MGFLSLFWFFKQRSKQRANDENTYKQFVQKIIDLLESQYEEHLRDADTHPWLAISHVRDMLVPVADRYMSMIVVRLTSILYDVDI
jgi:hypothetical protein